MADPSRPSRSGSPATFIRLKLTEAQLETVIYALVANRLAMDDHLETQQKYLGLPVPEMVARAEAEIAKCRVRLAKIEDVLVPIRATLR